MIIQIFMLDNLISVEILHIMQKKKNNFSPSHSIYRFSIKFKFKR